MDLKEAAILGDSVNRHWYYQAKAEAVRRYVESIAFKSILDVGAGSGFFTKQLMKTNPDADAVCVDTGYDGERTEAMDGRRIRYKKQCDKSAADLVLLMDVLEHVDDDIGLLKQYIGRVAPGTYFLISVPAFAFLWSGHDVFLEHKRRYNLKTIESVVVESGLKIERLSFFFLLVFPLACLTRLAEKRLKPTQTGRQSQLMQHSRLVNTVLYSLCRMELPLVKLNRLAGLSIFCLAKKI